MESPSQFKQKIKELNQRYFLIIDEVVKTYPNYKIKENNDMLQDSYKKNLGNLQKLQAEFFLFKNNINKNTETLNDDIKQIDEKIYELDENNKILKQKLDSLTNSDNAAYGMLEDSKHLYKLKSMGNSFLMIIIISIILSTAYGNFCPTFLCISMIKSGLARLLTHYFF